MTLQEIEQISRLLQLSCYVVCGVVLVWVVYQLIGDKNAIR